MGQKTHPIGLRLGLHRKWASSWFTTFNVSSNKNKIGPYLLARGGTAQNGIEAFIINIIRRRTIPFSSKLKTSGAESRSTNPNSSIQTEIQNQHRFFPASVQVIVGSAGTLFIVFFYIKLFGRDNTQLW